MTKTSARITLTEQNRAIIEQTAHELGCTHVKNRGISQLLEKIAEGELVLSHKSDYHPSKTVAHDKTIAKEPIIELVANFRSDLNGSIAALSKRIAESHGNIYAINAHENIDHIHINFEVGEKNNNLFEAIEKILFEELIGYNPPDKVKEFVQRTTETSDEEYSDPASQKFKINRCKTFPVIDNLRLMFCFRIEAENKPKVLADVSQRVAKKKITIRSIYQGIDYNSDTGFIDLTIVINPTTYKNVFEEVEKLKTNIGTIKNVKSIHQINVEPGLNPPHP